MLRWISPTAGMNLASDKQVSQPSWLSKIAAKLCSCSYARIASGKENSGFPGGEQHISRPCVTWLLDTITNTNIICYAAMCWKARLILPKGKKGTLSCASTLVFLNFSAFNKCSVRQRNLWFHNSANQVPVARQAPARSDAASRHDNMELAPISPASE